MKKKITICWPNYATAVNVVSIVNIVNSEKPLW